MEEDLEIMDEDNEDERTPTNWLSDDDMGQPSITTDNLKFLQDNQQEIFHLIMSLKRKTLCTDGKYRSSNNVKPMLNSAGLQYIKTILDATLIKISSLSTFTEEDVYGRATSITEAIIDNFQLNFKNYKIDKSDLSTIIRIINNLIYSHYARALKGADKKFISGVYGYKENVTKKDGDTMRV